MPTGEKTINFTRLILVWVGCTLYVWEKIVHICGNIIHSFIHSSKKHASSAWAICRMWAPEAQPVDQASFQETVVTISWPSSLKPSLPRLADSHIFRELSTIIHIFLGISPFYLLSYILCFLLPFLTNLLYQTLEPCVHWASAWCAWLFLAYPAHYFCWSLLLPVSDLWWAYVVLTHDLFLMLPHWGMLILWISGLIYVGLLTQLWPWLQVPSSTIVAIFTWILSDCFKPPAPPHSKRSTSLQDMS